MAGKKKAKKKTIKNPFKLPGKRANFAKLIRGGSTAASARRLVNSNPRWK